MAVATLASSAASARTAATSTHCRTSSNTSRGTTGPCGNPAGATIVPSDSRLRNCWNVTGKGSTPTKRYVRIGQIVYGSSRHLLGEIPSFYPFFYENLKNSTFNDLLRKILTNKVALKKIQHKEAAIGIN